LHDPDTNTLATEPTSRRENIAQIPSRMSISKLTSIYQKRSDTTVGDPWEQTNNQACIPETFHPTNSHK